MNPICRDCQSAMLETAPERPAAESALGAHLAGCEACSQAFARMCNLRAALGQLSRPHAPAALDGLVVAATQAGQRQERALAHLRAALRHEAPARLDARVGAAGAALLGEVPRIAAPSVLERLVREELRDPQHALTRRYVSRLQRLGPPASLRERVSQALARPRRRAGRNLLLGGAAVAVLLLAMWGWWSLERANLRPRIQVVYVKDAGELEPLARDMLLGATGGWSELVGKAR
jgi:hypothetical protein